MTEEQYHEELEALQAKYQETYTDFRNAKRHSEEADNLYVDCLTVSGELSRLKHDHEQEELMKLKEEGFAFVAHNIKNGDKVFNSPVNSNWKTVDNEYDKQLHNLK